MKVGPDTKRMKCISCGWTGYRDKHYHKPCFKCKGKVKLFIDQRVYHTFTEAEDNYLRENFDKITYGEIARRLNISYSIIQRRINKKLGLKLSAEIYHERHYKGCFKKGQKSWNKGCHTIHKGSEKSWFKKGHQPANTLFDGAIVIRFDHYNRSIDARPIKFIRVNKGKWVEYQKYIWEKHNGPIPKGMVIRFKDGDSMNTDINNLMLITKAQNLMMNKPDDLYTTRCASKNLTDGYIAGQLARGNKELKEELLKNKPLLELRRAEIKFKKTLKERKFKECS
jgi:hypothetical protein